MPGVNDTVSDMLSPALSAVAGGNSSAFANPPAAMKGKSELPNRLNVISEKLAESARPMWWQKHGRVWRA
jgi:hypothetical protein